MPKIIQFLHTANEAIPTHKDANYIPWNNHEDHRRKFIKSEGKYIDSHGQEQGDELTFWGEWEAQSRIINLRSEKKYFPHYLNIPYINPTVPNRTHNTDPNVFGNRFKYIICKQTFFHNVLTDLEEKSLILFGSSINKEFCLDTLFVVSRNKKNYNISSIEDLFPKEKRGQFYHASVNPIYDDTNYNENVEKEESCRMSEGNTYTYYESVNYSERNDYNRMYSFVPSKIFNQDKEFDYVFKQPKIDLDFIRHPQTQGINTKDCNLEEIIAYWNKIQMQLDNQGLLKGTWFRTPEMKYGGN